MAHLAAKLQLRGAAPLVERFRQDPDTDIYSFMAEQAGIERKKAKVVFLGLSYGMGKGKLATQLGCTPDEAAALVAKFNENVPFVAELMEGVQRRVHERGFVKTILGRICRFDTWEPARRQDTWEAPLPRAAAAAKWPGQALKRAWAYKGLNRVIQGGAADQTKKALLDLWKQGIVPMLQVHDELCVSVETREQAEVVRETMVHAVELDVPTKVDLEIGPSWGEAK